MLNLKKSHFCWKFKKLFLAFSTSLFEIILVNWFQMKQKKTNVSVILNTIRTRWEPNPKPYQWKLGLRNTLFLVKNTKIKRWVFWEDSTCNAWNCKILIQKFSFSMFYSSFLPTVLVFWSICLIKFIGIGMYVFIFFRLKGQGSKLEDKHSCMVSIGRSCYWDIFLYLGFLFVCFFFILTFYKVIVVRKIVSTKSN